MSIQIVMAIDSSHSHPRAGVEGPSHVLHHTRLHGQYWSPSLGDDVDPQVDADELPLPVDQAQARGVPVVRELEKGEEVRPGHGKGLPVEEGGAVVAGAATWYEAAKPSAVAARSLPPLPASA